MSTIGNVGAGTVLDTGWQRRQVATKFTLSEPATFSSITAQLISAGINPGYINFQYGIWADSAGVPGALLGSTDQSANIQNTADTAYTLSFSTLLEVDPADIWIGLECRDVGGGAMDLNMFAGSAKYVSNLTSVVTDPFGATTPYALALPIYATYTVTPYSADWREATADTQTFTAAAVGSLAFTAATERSL